MSNPNSPTRAFHGSAAPGELDKYNEKKIPGYTGYIPGTKFGIARTPYPTQSNAADTVRKDTIRQEEDIVYGNEKPKPLARPTTMGAPPNLHPDDHNFDTCRPPTILGNPSNEHSMVFGDNRIPGSYGRETTHRETFKGPRCRLQIPGEVPLTTLYSTPAELKIAYDRALKRAGKKRVEEILSSMSKRINAKLGNNGASAFALRNQLQTLSGFSGDEIHLDDMRQLMMTVCGITLEINDLLALFCVYDEDASGTISMSELMQGLVDEDYFSFFLGRNLKLKEALTVVTDNDRKSLAVLALKLQEIGPVTKVFRLFDKNANGTVSRAEFKLTCEEMHCPLSPAGLDHFWTQADTSADGNLDFSEFAKIMQGHIGVYADSIRQTSAAGYGALDGQPADHGMGQEGVQLEDMAEGA